MKTKEELNALKEEVETVSRKLHELTEEELELVSGGGIFSQLFRKAKVVGEPISKSKSGIASAVTDLLER